MIFDIPSLVKTAGYLGVFGIVFAETGLLVGFFLPGDSLLFTAGILASQGYLNIWWLCLGLFISAVVGDSVGYAFGKKVGPKIFKREDSLFFHKDHILRAQNFFHKHGGKTIIIARFVPVVRTFAPVVAGVGHMRYGRFLAYNIVGALLWAVGITVFGYWLGSTIPDVEKYIAPGIVIIILLSISPGIYHVLKNKESRDSLLAMFRPKK